MFLIAERDIYIYLSPLWFWEDRAAVFWILVRDLRQCGEDPHCGYLHMKVKKNIHFIAINQKKAIIKTLLSQYLAFYIVFNWCYRSAKKERFIGWCYSPIIIIWMNTYWSSRAPSFYIVSHNHMNSVISETKYYHFIAKNYFFHLIIRDTADMTRHIMTCIKYRL